MAQGKKISELTEVSSVTDNDEFLFVDKEGSGANSGVGGQTAKIKFSDLKSAIGAGTTGAKGALGDKGMKGEPGPRGYDGTGTQYWTQSPSDGDAVYYNAGNVGIGTDAPTGNKVSGRVLDITDSEASILRLNRSSGADYSIAAIGGRLSIYDNNLDGESLVIKDGNVGIGTDAPRGAFHVQPTSDRPFTVSSTGMVGIGVSQGGANMGSDLSQYHLELASHSLGGPTLGLHNYQDSLTEIGKINFVVGQGNGIVAAQIIGSRDFGDGTGTSLRFLTKGTNADPVQERMIISANGNVGIGTAEPSTSLDINGNMAINKAINFRRKESELNGGSPKTQAFIRAKHIQEGVQPNSNLDPIVTDPDNFRTDMPSGMEIGPFLHVGYTGETAHSNTMKDLTGKLAAVANSNKITGTDTKFLSELAKKHILRFGASVHMVASVESDTELTLTNNWDWWKTSSTFTYNDLTDQTAQSLAERAGLRVSPQIGSAAAICFSDNNNTDAMTYLTSGTTSSGWVTKDYKTAIGVRQSTGDVCIGRSLPDCKLHVWSDDEPGKAQVKISARQGANPTSDGSAKPAELIIENEKLLSMFGVKESKGHIINRPNIGLETCIRSEYLVDYPSPTKGSQIISKNTFAPITFGYGGGAKYQMQDKAFFNGMNPFTQYNPTGHFFLANHPWAEHTTYEGEYAGKFYYSPEHRGMVCNGITGVVIRCFIPIDPTCSYRVTVRAKQISASTLPGENVFYAGVESFDYNYNTLNTDDRNSYNYGLANARSDLKDNIGVSQTFTANFHGYNPPASEGTGDADKFDPEASFFNVAMLANYNSNGGERPSNGVTVIEMVEVKKLDT